MVSPQQCTTGANNPNCTNNAAATAITPQGTAPAAPATDVVTATTIRAPTASTNARQPDIKQSLVLEFNPTTNVASSKDVDTYETYNFQPTRPTSQEKQRLYAPRVYNSQHTVVFADPAPNGYPNAQQTIQDRQNFTTNLIVIISSILIILLLFLVFLTYRYRKTISKYGAKIEQKINSFKT